MGQVFEQVRGYICENNHGKDQGCPFILWKERFGRYIDRRLAMAVLAAPSEEHGPILWFTDPKATQFLEASVKLVREVVEVEEGPEKIKWVLQVERGKGEGDAAPEVFIAETGWTCPAEREDCEACMIIETTHRWVCKCVFDGKQKRGPQLPRIVCQREMEDSEASQYFGEAGRTELFDDFVSKRGNNFRAFLFRKETGKHGFEFPPRGGDKEGEKASDDAKPGRKTAAKKTTRKKTSAAKGASTKKPATKKSAGTGTKKASSRKKAEPSERTATPPPTTEKKSTRRRLRTATRSGPTSKTTALSRTNKNAGS